MRTIQREIIYAIIALAVGLGSGFFIGYTTRKRTAESKIESAEEYSLKIVEESRHTAETKKKELLLEAKEEVHKIRTEADQEVKDRRAEVTRLEKRIIQREETIDKKMETIDQKEETLLKKTKEIENLEEVIKESVVNQKRELEKISGLTSEEAKVILFNNVEKETKHEMAMLIKEIENTAKLDADKKAREIVSYAIQKCSSDHVAETTVSVVSLPSDDMKGRIIGREGRNIRTIETLTGIDLIIDDTPEAVILSGFDPIRREVARITLERLIADGRIHPARIEEMVEKAKKEVENNLRESGEQATFDTGVHGVHPEVVRLLGRLKFRTSYGQNVLKHSIEVSHLAGIMAAELGADVKIAKRAGLLHDLGKAVDHEVEGSHVQIGADLLKKYKESDEIIHAVMAHHGDVEATTVEAVLVQAADAISAARPGARRETLESYVKRLEKLEEIANSFDGIEKSFAIQAGREIRIMVKPDVVDDANIIVTARAIVKRIEAEMEYPGQIKINVIRETRAIEYAK